MSLLHSAWPCLDVEPEKEEGVGEELEGREKGVDWIQIHYMRA